MPRDLLAEQNQPRDLLADKPPRPTSKPWEWANVAAGSFIEGIPIAGPYIREGLDRLGAAYLSTVYDQPYDETLQRLKGFTQDLKAERPITSTIGGMAGAVAGTLPMVMAAPLAFGAGGGPLLGRSLASAATGGTIGGLDAGARSEWDFDAMTRGAIAGGSIGAAVPLASHVVGSGWQAIKDAQAVKASAKAAGVGGNMPTAAQIRASAGYDALRDAMKNAKLSGKDYQGILRQVWAEAQDFGLTTDLKRKFAGTISDHLGRIKKTGVASLHDLELLRRSLRNVGGDTTDRAAQALSSRMIEKLDDLVDNLSVSQISGEQGGRPVVEVLKEARNVYRVGKKAQIIEDAIARAQNAASGVENGLRTEFRKILNNQKLRQNFTSGEIATIEKVVRGDLATNALRWLGTFGYPIDQGRSFLGSAVGGGAGAGIGSMFGGPVGAAVGGLAVPAAGTAARLAASRATQNAAMLAEQAVKAPIFSSTYQNLMVNSAGQRALKEAIVNAIMRGSGLELAR